MPPDTAGPALPDELYGAAYYASHCGPVPYARDGHWLGVFGRVADELVRAFAPRRAFDAWQDWAKSRGGAAWPT